MNFDECTKIQYGVLFKYYYSQSFLNFPHPPTPTLMKSFNFNIWLSPKKYIFSNPKVGYIRHCSEIEEASRVFFIPPDEFDQLTYDNTQMKHIIFSYYIIEF